MKLNMCVYLHTNCQVSSIILTSCRQGVILPTSTSLKSLIRVKVKLTVKRGNNGRKDVELIVPLKNLSNFWRTLEISLINCEIRLDLN